MSSSLLWPRARRDAALGPQASLVESAAMVSCVATTNGMGRSAETQTASWCHGGGLCLNKHAAWRLQYQYGGEMCEPARAISESLAWSHLMMGLLMGFEIGLSNWLIAVISLAAKRPTYSRDVKNPTPSSQPYGLVH